MYANNPNPDEQVVYAYIGIHVYLGLFGIIYSHMYPYIIEMMTSLQNVEYVH